MLFMTPLSAVVELFPYHIDHTVCATLAGHLGLANYPVHGTNATLLKEKGVVR
jgi:hypothetical protein